MYISLSFSSSLRTTLATFGGSMMISLPLRNT